MTSQQIRQAFIDFFVQRHGHTFVPSSPVVPLDDPTLLFTNAGMNQFKPIFLGQERRSYTRACNTQKSIRAGGKHNDLDDVGRSRRHHTFFEMLGNWSFGDYFKRGAIEMAWELLTQVWKLDPTRLHVSCYEGNAAAGIPRDTEAADLWKQIAGLPDDHIHYFGKDNFWEMGDTGPCGPCTEIYIDRTEDKTGGPQVNGEDPRVMEIWNLVFIQYNRDASGKLTTLPAQHVDTGMGLERICQVIQDKSDNYATDLWTPLFDAITQISNLKYTGLFPKTNAADPVAEAANPQLRHDIAFRVIADHVRCLTFALSDGAVPSNEGRGYVLRRILRRAVRFGRQQLNLKEPFLHSLVPVIVETMGGAFPELKKSSQHVIELIKDEEISFSKTLDRGINLFTGSAVSAYRKRFNEAQQTVPASKRLSIAVGTGWRVTDGERDAEEQEMLRSGVFPYDRGGEVIIQDGNHDIVARFVVDEIGSEQSRQWISETPVISGSDAFKLHDTYGFPIDLTRIMAEERGMTVDLAGYEKLMEQARELARSGGKDASQQFGELSPDDLAQLAQAGVKPTVDRAKFLHEPIHARVMAIWNGDDMGLSPADAFEDEQLAIILDRTNFYAEMGGQVGDTGVLTSVSMAFDVESTKTIGGFTLHIGRLRSGKMQVGDAVTATVAKARDLTEKNHTSTHLANWALREVLGEGVQQKGSLVDPEKLRFDFSHPKALGDDELERVESLVNQSIKRKLPVYAEEAPQEQALKINGLRAVFGEKYPPMVRVVSIGAPVSDLLSDPANPKWRAFSIEFCGGTHLPSSDAAEYFAITAEESVSKGIRRLVAVTGVAACAANEAAARVDALIAQAKSAPDDNLAPSIAQLNQALTTPLPLRAKRRAQAAVAELQSRSKAWEKKNKSQSAGTGDVQAVASALLASGTSAAGGTLIIGEVPGATDEQLRSAMDSLRKRTASHGILLGSVAGDKVAFVAAVSDDLIVKGLKAGDWVREAAKIAGGGGGGSPKMAQAGGKDPSKLPDALAVAKTFALSALNR
jgi:alanyl-tRNA synthetase